MSEKCISPSAQMCALILTAAERSVLRKAVFSKPQDTATRRTVLTLRRIKGRVLLQAETFCTDNKALHRNFEINDRERIDALIASHGQVSLLTAAGDCELRVSRAGKTTLIGGNKVSLALQSADVPALEIGGNDREKKRILTGEEPFLKLLGVSDAQGRIKDKKQSKFRQINRFLELIADCLPSLCADGTLRICDLCCGKSYLSFAAYHYFCNVLGRKVRMTGVDLKPDVVAYCNEVARALRFDGLEFLCGDIGTYDAGEHVDLAISLHACDTATDLVLSRAMLWEADVILSTPCCHHELNHTINCQALSFVTEHSMLRQKLCDAATDAMRLKLLQANGYEVCALELIDPEETPKNIMLRALRRRDFARDGEEAKRYAAEYEAAKRFLLG
ncbi:MAG: SAM-dependent methyltransferase [Clostridia bacterium]|nr:SAM-dependent methyltransferase [Clostridia bacterium]